MATRTGSIKPKTIPNRKIEEDRTIFVDGGFKSFRASILFPFQKASV